jgi:formylglycine-generating enzyme required for sulfatase activity
MFGDIRRHARDIANSSIQRKTSFQPVNGYIEREQWAYDPDEGFGNGMRLKANYLELEGYRLATEAEWEFAARGGTETSRFTGDSDAHLELYAWFAKNSDGLRMLPVGSLRPNPFGLFDVYGNVAEWTQDDAQEYDVSREVTADYEQSGTSAVLNNMTYRKMRGGSLLEREQMIRSAYRAMRRPDEQVYGVGFRVVRTMGDVGVAK